MNELANKIIRFLPRSWEANVTIILEARDLTKLEVDQFIGSLITHEMINFNDDKRKRKDLALKASSPNNDDEDIKDEKILLLSRKVE